VVDLVVVVVASEEVRGVLKPKKPLLMTVPVHAQVPLSNHGCIVAASVKQLWQKGRIGG